MTQDSSHSFWVEHFTKETDWQLKPIELLTDTHGIGWKPDGALYTSPIYSNYSWADWCKDNRYGLGRNRIVLEVDYSNCFVVNSVRTMEKLPWFTHMPYLSYVDWWEVKQQGIDCIWLTEEGERLTRFTHPHSLYGWDCETVAILNERCIVNWRQDTSYAPEQSGIETVGQEESRLEAAC